MLTVFLGSFKVPSGSLIIKENEGNVTGGDDMDGPILAIL
jgi:hypothetical protein